MRRLIGIVAALFVVVPIGAQQPKGDKEQLEALVREYTRLEDAGDFQTQAKLIAPDRWWHGNGGRRTDQALYVRLQEENLAANRQRFPGLKFMREARDLQIRMLAPTAAVTSFTWHVNRIIPGDIPPEKRQALGPAPVPSVISLVWLKGADGWKIVNSHISPEYVRP